ncbi:MAG: Maf family protein [Spirochaetia bacterium]|jgi:septum formation protein
METIILASGSPRRRELLTKVKLPIKVIPPDITEDHTAYSSIPELVARLSRKKVEAILGLFKTESPRWILGLDTVVEVDGKVLGKPSGPEEAETMLRLLSGKVHRVYSGLTLLVERGKPLEQEVVTTEVKFRELTPGELRFYLDTGEWAGAAGGYRIQERGAFFVEWIRGSYSNVVGLPLEAFYGILVRNEYHF